MSKQESTLVPDSTSSSSEPASPSREPSTSDHARLQRSSSIRFSQTTKDSSGVSMANRVGVVPLADEITPIRQAEGVIRRSYNTSDERQNAQSNSAVTRTPQSIKASAATGSENDTAVQKQASWYKRIVEKYGSVTLDNKGSVARDHLALERTFLAWLRTSLAFASIGIAITQLFRLNTSLARRSMSFDLNVPLAPLLGHSIPAELLPYLQQMTAVIPSSVDTPTLGPTLLDQLLLLPPVDSVPISAIKGNQLGYHDSASAEKIPHLGKPLGATFIGISIVVLMVGFHRYFESQYWIIRGKFPASRGSVALVGLIAGALIVASLVVVVVVHPSQLEKR